MLEGLIRNAPALALICVLTGCASATQYQQLPVGTTLEQAASTIGRPRNTVTLNTSHGTCELWPTQPPDIYYRIFCGGTYRMCSFAAREIYAAYKQNQFAADERWGKTWFVVNGWVEGMGKDILGTPYLSLCPGDLVLGGCGKSNPVGTVQCMFRREDAQRLASVKKNDMAVLRCERAGFLVMNVILNNCSFFDGLPTP